MPPDMTRWGYCCPRVTTSQPAATSKGDMTSIPERAADGELHGCADHALGLQVCGVCEERGGGGGLSGRHLPTDATSGPRADGGVSRGQWRVVMARCRRLRRRRLSRMSHRQRYGPGRRSMWSTRSPAGVVGGYPDGTYRPAVVCTRDQMAVFVARAFALPM